MSRPLRLTAEEALALVIGLRTLAEVPGHHRRRRGQSGAGQDRGRRRRHRRRRHGQRVARRRPRGSCRSCGWRSRRPGAVAALLHRDPRRDHRSHRRPAARLRARRPRLPRGLVPAGRGHAAVSGRPDRAGRPARRAGPAAGRRRAARPVRRRLHAGAGAPAGRAAGRPAYAWVGRLLPERGSRSNRTGAARSACGSPTRPGCGRWCSDRRARSRCSRPSGWPSRSATRPAPPSPDTSSP